MSTEFWLSSVKVHYGVGNVCRDSVQYVDAQMFLSKLSEIAASYYHLVGQVGNSGFGILF